MRQDQINLGEDRTADGLQTRLANLAAMDSDIAAKETELAAMRDSRNEQRLALWRLASSTRMAVTGIYGTDSMQYQALGGTRGSERKPVKRNPKATKS